MFSKFPRTQSDVFNLVFSYNQRLFISGPTKKTRNVWQFYLKPWMNYPNSWSQIFLPISSLIDSDSNSGANHWETPEGQLQPLIPPVRLTNPEIGGRPPWRAWCKQRVWDTRRLLFLCRLHGADLPGDKPPVSEAEEHRYRLHTTRTKHSLPDWGSAGGASGSRAQLRPLEH